MHSKSNPPAIIAAKCRQGTLLKERFQDRQEAAGTRPGIHSGMQFVPWRFRALVNFFATRFCQRRPGKSSIVKPFTLPWPTGISCEKCTLSHGFLLHFNEEAVSKLFSSWMPVGRWQVVRDGQFPVNKTLGSCPGPSASPLARRSARVAAPVLR